MQRFALKRIDQIERLYLEAKMYVKIKIETLLEILYFINNLLAHTKEDYNKLSKLTVQLDKEIKESNVELKNYYAQRFYYIRQVISNVRRMKIIMKKN